MSDTMNSASTPKKKIAKGYIRVSTQMQKDEGVSLETQKERIETYCKYKDFELIRIYADEGISGTSIKGREGMIDLLENINKGEYIVFFNLSRLGRNTIESLWIIDYIHQKEAFLCLLDLDIDASTYSGRMVITTLCAVNQMERDKISHDVRINLQRLSREGKLRSKAPYGWKFVSKDTDFQEIPEQQEVIKIIVNMYKMGFSYNLIANKLNLSGYGETLNLNRSTSKENPRFHAQTVKTILQHQGLLKDGDRTIDKRIKSHHTPKSSVSVTPLTKLLEK